MTKAICAREGCEEEFDKTAHNMKYHSPECRKVVSDKKTLDRYHDIKANKSNRHGRVCERCDTELSQYNGNKLCSQCQYKEDNKDLARIIDMHLEEG